MSNLVFLSVLLPPCFQETNRCGLWNLTSTWPSFLFLLSHIIFFLFAHWPLSLARWTFGEMFLCEYMSVYVYVQVHVCLNAHVCT